MAALTFKLTVPGPVRALAATETPPDEGVAFRADGKEDRDLYIDGRRVGVLLAWPFEYGNECYDDEGFYFVVATPPS